MARKALGKQAYTYWLPFVLDTTTSLENLPYGSKGEAVTLAMPFLENAKEYFKLALEMEPSYIAANVNLAITTSYIWEKYSLLEQRKRNSAKKLANCYLAAIFGLG